MRKWNAIISAAVLVLFILHAVLGSLQLTGLGHTVLKPLAWIMVGLIAVHVILSTILTVGSLRVWRRTGTAYFRENRLFWARRISGFAILVLIFFHLTAFGHTVEGIYRLRVFDAARLTTQLLLVAAVAVHLITNIKPMLISFGIRALRPRAADILFFLSVLLLIAAAAFILYSLRWSAV